MKNLRTLNLLQTASLVLVTAILAGCSNSPSSRLAPPPVRAIMKIRKLREREANPSPSPSPSATTSQTSASGTQEAAPAPGGIIGGVIERRLQQAQ